MKTSPFSKTSPSSQKNLRLAVLVLVLKAKSCKLNQAGNRLPVSSDSGTGNSSPVSSRGGERRKKKQRSGPKRRLASENLLLFSNVIGGKILKDLHPFHTKKIYALTPAHGPENPSVLNVNDDER